MFKKLLNEIKSATVTLWDEVHDEIKPETATCYLTVAGTSLYYFRVNEEIKVTFTEDTVNLESINDEGMIVEVPCSAILEISYKDETINGTYFKGSYMLFESEDRKDFIYLKAAKTEPHFFLECVQRLRIVEELNDKRYSRTATPINQLCEGCGAVIHEANCSHCGFMNPMAEDAADESGYEYYVDPQYRVILSIHNCSIPNLAENDKVFYHVYEDCVVLRVRGTTKSYVPINIVILFENMLSFSLNDYDNSGNPGLYISYKDNGTQFVQLKALPSNTKAPYVNLEYNKKSFKLEDIISQRIKKDGTGNRICNYCGMAVSSPICPYCGGVL